MSRRIDSPLDANSLRDPLQSKYCTRRSTETAQMKVHNDIVYVHHWTNNLQQI